MTPRPYQEAGRDFLAARRFAYLGDEMRVGKTPQAILAAQKVGAMKTIVVCPAIAVPHWGAEWWRWWPQAQVQPIVVSYDRLRLNAAGILAENWDLAIVDEAHFAKNPAAQRTKLIYGKGGLGWAAKRMWALSGTPAPKNAAELWPMLRAFGAVSMTYMEFVNRYCYCDETGRIIGTRMKFVAELRDILARVMLRRRRKEVAPEMPAIAFEFLEITPTTPADIHPPIGASDAELLGWLAQHHPETSDDRQAVAMAKVEPLAEEIAEALKAKLYDRTVVFGWHVAPLYALEDALRRQGVSAEVINGATTQPRRAAIQSAFREGQLQVVAANILAAGTAIDLSSASHGYFLELDWTPGNNVQAANRLVSMDKHEPVTFDVVTWPGSADDAVNKVLLRRANELAKLY